MLAFDSRVCVYVALLLVACGSSSSPVTIEATGSALTCSLTLSPEDVLREAAEAAAERWGSARGCNIEVGEGGVTIGLTSRIDKADGTQAPGITSDDRQHVFIHARSSQAQRATTVLHELCHVFGVGAEHVATDGVCGGHPGLVYVIDDASLTGVCARSSCPGFSPEWWGPVEAGAVRE